MQPIMRLYGFLLVGLAVMMLLPMCVELYAHTNDWQVFAATSFTTALPGILLLAATHGYAKLLHKRFIFIFTTSVWLILPLFAALPFLYTGTNYHLGLVDAYFETVSGLTTTGSTVLSGLDTAPKGLLLWRSMLEWIGGIGIIVIAMAIFPTLHIGGMQLFRSESSDRTDKILPHARQIALATVTVYVSLTIICAICLIEAGMSPFDALNHAMASLSTGGFSTHDASMAHYQNDLTIINLTSLFMLLGGIPMILYFTLIIGKKPHRILISQTRIYLSLLFILTVLFTWRLISQGETEIIKTISHVAFNLISIITTTGFASEDYTLWGDLLVSTIFFLTIVGGCTGSTSGGVKIFRFQVMAKLIRVDLSKLIMPHGIFKAKIGGQPIDSEAEFSVKTFFVLFCFVFLIISGILLFLGLDMTTSFSGAATALANVGPGLGDIIGPTGNFASLPDAAKMTLAFGMIIGRLEIVTFLLVLNPIFWKNFR